MFLTTLQGMWAHKFRVLTATFAIALGVSFLVGTLVLTDTISQTFNNVFSDVYRGTDAMVRGVAVFQGPQNSGAQRARVDASLVTTVRAVPQVAEAEGLVMGYARLTAKDGRALGNPANGAPTLGGAWPTVSPLNSFTVVSGRWPRADDEVVIDKGSATKGNLHVGDTTTVVVQGGVERVRIAGIAKFGRADSPGGASIVIFTMPAAQRLVGAPAKFDEIAVAGRPGVSQAQLAAAIQPVLAASVEAVTGAQVVKESDTQIHQGMAFFNTFLLIFAIVALIAGGFMIFNTFSVTVAQRMHENGLLRALGASRRQVLWSVLFEALAVGVIGSVAGFAVGVVVAAGLKGLLAALGIDIPAGGLVVASKTVVAAAVVGTGITMAAALIPSRKAAKVPPVAAMQDAQLATIGYGRWTAVAVGAGVLLAGIAVLFTGLFAGLSNTVAIVGVGAVVVILGVSLLGRPIARPLSRALGAPLPRVRGITGELARENSMRNPRRTAATASALMVCVAVVGLMNIMASSTRASISSIVKQAFTGDFVADPGGGAFGGVDHSLDERVSKLPQVAAATAVRVTSAKIEGSVQQLLGVDPATLPPLLDYQPLRGSINNLGVGDIAVYESMAKDKHLSIGDPVQIVFKDTGPKTLRVALIYGRNQPAGNYFVSMSAFDANVSSQLDYGVYIKKAPGATKAATLAAIQSVTKDYPGVTVMDQAGFKANLAKPFNQLLGLVYALLVFAVLIAALGIANTLALSVYERTRELGLLRAVGMTRSQLRSTLRWEAVLIALQGTLLGLIVAIFFGWALLRALAGTTGTLVLSLPYRTLAAVVVFAALLGVVAAVMPGRRASKLNVLQAVVTE
jgi:putative ABC transport system permease protein